MAVRIRVLLAESDAKTAQAIMVGLRDRGIEATAANDAVHVVQMARTQQPDAVILSARLAGGGVAALQRIRSNVNTAHIPVIGIAGAGVQSKQMALAGAQECFAPPIDFDKLGEAIRKNQLQELDFTQAPSQVLQDPDRIADVVDAGLLDTPPEKSFDRLTGLAAKLLNAPTALVTVVDKERQFFKSQVGLAQPWAGERQTRLSHSFCQWVVAGRENVVVANANDHAVLKYNLAIRDLGVVAYAGVPLDGRKGNAIGSFCAIDSKPREWSAAELATLEDLARIAQAYVTLGEARRSKSAVRDLGKSANLNTSALVAGNAILGAAHILRRGGEALGAAERADILDIIEEQASHLAR